MFSDEKIRNEVKNHIFKNGITKCGKGIKAGLVPTNEPISEELKKEIEEEMKKVGSSFPYSLAKSLNNN